LVLLGQHKDTLAKALSGGMKRKLSLAMALVGGSKCIILDEPTSGLDVESRRNIWSLIKSIKKDRSIIMSSQHLEEADELSDRIAIMSHGQLLALDTSLGIKKRFGVGYNLFLEPEGISREQFQGMAGRVHEVMVDPHFSNGVEISVDSNPRKLVYVFPFDEVPKMPAFLEHVA
jgi:ABC-type multidrug transport system ATPase subunit